MGLLFLSAAFLLCSVVRVIPCVPVCFAIWRVLCCFVSMRFCFSSLRSLPCLRRFGPNVVDMCVGNRPGVFCVFRVGRILRVSVHFFVFLCLFSPLSFVIAIVVFVVLFLVRVVVLVVAVCSNCRLPSFCVLHWFSFGYSLFLSSLGLSSSLLFP